MKSHTIIFLFIFLSPQLAQAQTGTVTVKTIKEITNKILEIISGGIDESRNWDEYRNLFLPTAHTLKKVI